MKQYELTIHPNADLVCAGKIIEACCAVEGLRVSLRSSLKRFPGSKHWHFKLGDNPGTLEITLWQRRLWCSVRKGRTGPWIDRVQRKVCRSVEAQLTAR
ncbi:MAG TPA: hypothetical protein VLZ12_11915 [Verrucomicrobiae bacterium]|nr:hypothetical protein [Verrucomicrobiae bacterium]